MYVCTFAAQHCIAQHAFQHPCVIIMQDSSSCVFICICMVCIAMHRAAGRIREKCHVIYFGSITTKISPKRLTYAFWGLYISPTSFGGWLPSNSNAMEVWQFKNKLSKRDVKLEKKGSTATEEKIRTQDSTFCVSCTR